MQPQEHAAEYFEKLLLLLDERRAAGRNADAREQEQLKNFAREFYRDMPPDELSARSLDNLYGALLCNWRFVREGRPEHSRVHVYNPDFEQWGWQSTHTIITLVAADMPFLLDSARMALNRRGLTVHMMLHPVFWLERGADGVLKSLEKSTGAAETNGDKERAPVQQEREAVLHLEVDRQSEPLILAGIARDLEDVLHDVQCTVEDWREMKSRMRSCLENLPAPRGADEEEAEENKAFLQWILGDHFTFLGWREYALQGDGGDAALLPAGPGLGLLRGAADGGMRREDFATRCFAGLPVCRADFGAVPELLLLSKAGARSRVHRPAYLDYVGVRWYDADGVLRGEHRFLGLYTSAAYHHSILYIPLLHYKVKAVLRAAGYSEKSHRGRALFNILENYPRDELFQSSVATLLENAVSGMHLQERQRTCLRVRPDPYRRFFACLVYVPRDLYDTNLRRRIQKLLVQAFNGSEAEFNVNLSESVLAQVYFTIHTAPGAEINYDGADLERRIADITRSWRDVLRGALLEHYGEERGAALFHRYEQAFPLTYREDFSARYAVYDIEYMENLDAPDKQPGMTLYCPIEVDDCTLRFKLFYPGKRPALSDTLPLLENMGVKVISERSYAVQADGRGLVWVQEFVLRHEARESIDIARLRRPFQESFFRVWHGLIENDGFNRLVVGAQLEWREVMLLRAYCKYLRQTNSSFSQAYMERVLYNNPVITRKLVDLFEARCDPGIEAESRAPRVETLRAAVKNELEAVKSLDEDRILRLFLGVIQATLRCNYYQSGADGQPKDRLAFKLDSAQVPELPEPRPMYEIFVYSPRVEGIHLRGGKVARGGLRWSDRPEDFRTEVLGLMKAQMVKNAVIVPVGSKGGFVVKQPPAEGGREAWLEEGIACYRGFIRGLLDLTDNLREGKIIAPPQTVRHDDDDPYLVVAADKGTATFSDTANAVAAEYGFWLDDAFASGGSAGYDHKKMGITARGAWESVKRHFRMMGRNIQEEDFSVVGIGDMSGDVFGNGMLLSRHIQLVGAFNHLHIFLDPAPDPAKSFAERKRLFELPRSTWEDYDAALISQGGGVYARSAKSIALSPQIRALLEIEEESLPPHELIRALLRAPVDLLWNGGIGTYVKAASEHHGEVGDRVNNPLRVNGRELRCKVVGEGGNLGFTQLGRVEYALQGGRIYIDAMDNSAGVDCSDHEVNIKILLNAVVAAEDMTGKQRDQLLAEMTDNVAAAVLRHNYLQSQEIAVSHSLAAQMLDVHRRFIHHLEQHGKLARALEFLPSDKALESRRKNGCGFTSPELCVLLLYAKNTLYEALLDSTLPEEEFLLEQITRYFPQPLPQRFPEIIQAHRLRREIICTQLSNTVIDHAGISFIYTLGEETGLAPADIVRAFAAAWHVFDMETLWHSVESLDNQIEASIQIELMLEVRKLLERGARRLLRSLHGNTGLRALIDFYRSGVKHLEEALPSLIAQEDKETLEQNAAALEQVGVPANTARRVTHLVTWLSALDIIEVAAAIEVDLEYVAEVHFLLGNRLKLHWLRDRISALPRDNRWHAMSRTALRDELYRTHREFSAVVLRCYMEKHADECEEAAAGYSPEQLVEKWLENNAPRVKRCRRILTEVAGADTPDLSMLSVALREVRVAMGQ